MQWKTSGEPLNEGIYVIHYCWEVEEGSFLGTDTWDGKNWNSELPVIEFAGPFNSITDAENFCCTQEDRTF